VPPGGGGGGGGGGGWRARPLAPGPSPPRGEGGKTDARVGRPPRPAAAVSPRRGGGDLHRMDDQVVSVMRRGRARAPLRPPNPEVLRPHPPGLAPAPFALVVPSPLVLPLPLLQGGLLARLLPLLDPSRPAADPHALGWLIALVLGASVLCHLGRMALAWLASATMTRVSLEVVRRLTDALHRKLQRLPMAYFDSKQTGRLMARVTSDVGTLLIFLNSGSLQLASDLVLALGISCVLLWLHWQLALVSL